MKQFDYIAAKGGQHQSPQCRSGGPSYFDEQQDTYFAAVQRAFGERAQRATGPEDHERMEREAQQAKRRHALLTARRRRVWRMVADAALIVTGVAVLRILQNLWCGEFLRALLMGGAAVLCWIAAGVIREVYL